MSKKIGKLIIVSLAALLLVLTQMDLSVLAQSDEVTQESSQNNTGENEAADAAEADQLQSEPAAEAEAPKTSVQGGRQLLGDAPTTQNAFAVYDGQDLATNADFSYAPKDAYTPARTLSIATSFPDRATVTGAKIEIKLNNVLQLAGAPGMVADGTNGWKFDLDKLVNDYPQQAGKISNAIYTPEKVNGWLTGKGTLTYEKNPGTNEVYLELTLKLNVTYSVRLFNGPTETFANVADISSSYTENGMDHEIESSKINNVTVTNAQNIWISMYQGGTMYRSIGDDVTVGTSLNPYVNTDSYSAGLTNVVVNELTYTVKINKLLNLTGVRTSSGTLSYTLTDDPSDAIYQYITYTVSNFKVASTLYFDFKLPDNIATGNYQVFSIGSYAGFTNSITRVDGSVETSGIVHSYGSTAVISVSDPNVASELELDTSNQTLAFQDFDASMNLLGNMQVKNTSANVITNRSGKLDFSAYSSKYGVEQVSLTIPNGMQVKNVVAKTNLNNTYSIATVTGTAGGAGQYVNISKSVLGITTDAEYITELTWDYAGSFPSGWVSGGTSSRLDYFQVSTIRYYGKILDMPADRKYNATLTVFETGNVSNSQTKTQAITVNDNSISMGSTVGLTGNLVTTQSSGSIYSASSTVDFTNYRYSNDMMRTLKGIAFYLRDTDYTIVNPDTLKVTWNGNTYQTSDGSLTAIEGVDNSNHKFYKLELPDVILGMGNTETASTIYPNATVTYDFKIKPSAPTTALMVQDIISVTPLDQSIRVTNGGWYSVYLTTDKYNVTGQANSNIPLGSYRQGYAFNITAKKAFLVTTAANLDDGPWVSYDYDTNQSIIDLNPSGDAKYQLAVTNNSGQTINGYTALVPIPKYGEKTDLTPATPGEWNPSYHLQKEAFGWTTALLEEINTSATALDYQVLYATTYETSISSPNFVTWDTITNKDNIRMVKIFTTDAIPDGTLDVIDFPLALTDPLADAHAGNMNIYSARVYSSIDGSAGYKPSEPIAIRLKTGIVTGIVFNDDNRNGLQDAGEIGRNGVSVIAYEAGTTNQLATATTQTHDGIAGVYKFMGLDKNQNVDIVFGNPNTDDSTRFSPVTSGGSTPTEAADHLKATTANITPSTTISTTINAGLITPTEVTMDAQGGETADNVIKRYPGETIASEPAVTREGYTFNGWFTASTGGTLVTFPYTVGVQDTTLYAQYTVNQYTLSYDVATNGGESGVPATQTINYGTKATKPADATKTGYTFNGWFTAASGGTAWDFNTTTMPAANTTLYAQFSINTYTTTFNIDGVVITTDVVYGNKVVEPATPSKEGYTFLGWYTVATGGTQWNFSTGTMPANNMTLYAQYSVNSYTLSFDIATNGGSGTAPTNQTVNYGTKATKPTDPSKTGYSFAGWFDASTGGNAWDFSTKTMPANDVTLYAQFGVDQYTVSFNNEGTITTETVAYGALVPKPVDPSKLGYTFNGWFDAETGGNEWNFSSDTMPANYLNLYVQYSANTYTLSFDAKDGSTVPAISAATDTPIDIDAQVTTKDGYTFLGWYDSNNTQVSGTINMYPYNATLTAKWQGIDQTIHLDVNDGDATSVPAAIVKPTGDSVNLETVVPTRAGYSFIGWFDASDVQHSGTFVMPVGGLQLKAKWTAVNQVITFNTYGGSGVDSIVAPTDSTVDISSVTTEQWSYGFLGWFDENGTQYSGTFAMPAGGLQLQAKWQDYIADGTWIISANDFKMTFAELQAKIADGTIVDSIIIKSDARAIDKLTNSDLGPLQVLNISELTSAPKAGTYQMTIAYTNPSATVSTYDLYTTNERVLSTTINVEVTAENTNSSSTNGLPQSGQNITFAALIGIILVVVAGILLVFSRSKKRL
ncbi:InlB B-repeat-containing protein [Culicoidibacter larvae]|uniref:Uncharacterized protein n=1 Tax=Culicoidibacter larvae TaxID=2579976 RepID=A0A5R8Q9X8_9FIRM|nr:InlB B-repeat-containing protein [Culicoidibacter larvae]TLG71772.1 hypothetical protein FEZ08_10210 [Culicoidibacter larvae]